MAGDSSSESAAGAGPAAGAESAGRAVVVGAGIGGLAAAAALSRDGWEVTVVERSADGRPIGAAIVLWGNALRAVDAIDPEVGARLRDQRSTFSSGAVRAPDGHPLIRIDEDELARQAGGAPVLVARPELTRLLATLVPDGSIRLGCRAVEVVRSGSRPVTVVTDRGELPAELVVAADGIGSALRATIAPAAEVVPAGYTTWRGMVPAGALEGLDGGETWGTGQRFGYIGMSDGGFYWYATLSTHDPRLWPETLDSMELDHLQHLFDGWHAPIPELLQATPIGSVIRTDVVMLWPLPSTYARGRVALLGDAAHAMTPDLGQGACQALEDAVELAYALRVSSGVEAGLEAYDRRRRPRTTRLAKQARTLGRIGQLDKGFALATRDAALRLVPRRFALKSFAAASSWQPPEV